MYRSLILTQTGNFFNIPMNLFIFLLQRTLEGHSSNAFLEREQTAVSAAEQTRRAAFISAKKRNMPVNRHIP
jgi:hypothetical protein